MTKVAEVSVDELLQRTLLSILDRMIKLERQSANILALSALSHLEGPGT
jgi:hypothetical protein